MSNHQPEDPEGTEIIVPAGQMAGVWSNLALVSHTEHEFTIDFIRMDSIAAQRGIVVARVAFSSSLMTRLIDDLDREWSEYAKEALPKEIYGSEEATEDNGQDA